MHRISIVFAALVLVSGFAVAQENPQLSESYRLHAAGDVAGAMRAMKSVVEAKPGDYFSRLRLAYLQLLLAEYANSADNYKRATELAPNALEPRLGHQQALVALGRYEESERVGQAALRLDEHNYYAISRIAWSLQMRKQYRDAADRYATLVELYPSDADMRLGLAHSQLMLGKKDEAARGYREVLSIVPGHKSAMEGLQACR